MFNPNLIRDVRNQLGLAKYQFAHLVGKPEATIYRWEGGKSKPNADSLAELLDICSQSGIDEVPLFLQGDEPVYISIKHLYIGNKTVSPRT